MMLSDLVAFHLMIGVSQRMTRVGYIKTKNRVRPILIAKVYHTAANPLWPASSTRAALPATVHQLGVSHPVTHLRKSGAKKNLVTANGARRNASA